MVLSIQPASLTLHPFFFGAIKIETETGKQEVFSRACCRSRPGWALLALLSPQERPGKLASRCLPWMWSFTRQLVHPWWFPRSPCGLQAAGGSRFRGQAGQEEMREVWEVAACHVGKQALVRDEGAQRGSGWDVLAAASLAVCWALIPGRGVGFTRCHQRHNWLRNLVGTMQVLAVAPFCSEGMPQAGWAGEEEMSGAHPSKLALEKPQSKPGAAAGSRALRVRQSAAWLLCGH